MPDRNLPRRHQRALRALRATMYLLIAYAGITAIVWTPRTIESRLGVGLTLAFAVAAILGTTVALVGVAMDRYRIEWPAVWLTAAGVSMYAVTVWSLVAETLTRQTQAAVCTALVLALASVGTRMSGQAAVDRVHHQVSRWTH